MYSSVLYLLLMLAVECCSALPTLAADDNATLPVAIHRSRRHVPDAARRECHRQVCYLKATFEHFKST